MRLFTAGLLLISFLAGAQSTVDVSSYGTLRGLMGHDLGGKVRLADLENGSDLYGLGAAEGLTGELLILAGQPFWTSVHGEELVTRKTLEVSAALLVVARVSDWQEINLPDSIGTQEDLEKYLLGWNHGDPFPFMLQGEIAGLDWHVINWDPEDHVHTHEKHKSSGFSSHVDQPMAITILGFHSTRHQGVFTHHSTTLHMHGQVDDHVGHVDSIVLSPGMSLKLPGYLKRK